MWSLHLNNSTNHVETFHSTFNYYNNRLFETMLIIKYVLEVQPKPVPIYLTIGL